MATILFDATRLFMRASRTSPTGIDRVTEAYGRWLTGRADVTLVPICSWGGMIWPMSRQRFHDILRRKQTPNLGSDENWRRLLNALSAPPGDGEALRAGPDPDPLAAPLARYASFAVRTVANWRPAAIQRGAIYLNVSHFGLEQGRLLDRLTEKGVRPVAMVHDLIPIAHPEYCSAPAFGWHLKRIEALLDHGALVIANSGSTAAELVEFAEATGRETPNVCVAPLGLEPTFSERPAASLVDRPYFVCVGTIEPRKNVAFLLTLWRRLAEQMGEATPALVLAGRRGWENEAIIDHLERSHTIRRYVHEVSGLGDDHLARLIGGANALLAPSFTEGFNLPVAEAAALGTPVIASDIAVHRELAQHAQLLDPVDGPAWLSAIQTATIRRPLSVPVRPFSWSDHFRIVARAIGLDEFR